jgi:F-type H+-transporting ATPase subunit epsilon
LNKRFYSKNGLIPSPIREGKSVEIMAEKKTFKLDIVNPERKVFAGEANFAAFPGEEGELGVLPFHAALLSGIRPGEVRVTHDQKTEAFAVSDGFLEVRDNNVTLVVETAEAAAEIDKARAQKAQEEVQELLNKTKDPKEILALENRLHKAAARIKVAGKKSA